MPVFFDHECNFSKLIKIIYSNSAAPSELKDVS